MTRCRSCGFLRILAFVHPLISLQPVPFSSAGHELPHAASSHSRKRQWVESGFGLGKVDQLRWHPFVFENVLDGFAITSAANKRILEGSASTALEIVDVPDDSISQHQGQ